jgi:pimeloyl-ACP methyl ester carboxylesterase
MTPGEPVEIGVGEQRVAGTLIGPAGVGAPGVLFVHGWGGSQAQYLGRAREAAALGCACLTIDLRGHARSDGRRETVTREDGLQDLLAAHDFLAARPGVAADSLGVVGSSYGGYLAAVLTALRQVRWLGLRAPAL